MHILDFNSVALHTYFYVSNNTSFHSYPKILFCYSCNCPWIPMLFEHGTLCISFKMNPSTWDSLVHKFNFHLRIPSYSIIYYLYLYWTFSFSFLPLPKDNVHMSYEIWKNSHLQIFFTHASSYCIHFMHSFLKCIKNLVLFSLNVLDIKIKFTN